MEDFKAIGISYHNSPLEVRESVALSKTETEGFLQKMKETLGMGEGLVVSTCNRTEIYYSSPKDISKELVSLLAAYKVLPQSSIHSYFKTYNSSDSINHLFEVSLGLDSQVLGDIQILNQVKRAYQMSADLAMAGPFLHRLMHTIFFANKRVVQETTLQDGSASVASVAVELIEGFIQNITDSRIVLIGLGEIGQNVLQNLKETGASVCLINRTRAKADKLAENSNVTVEDFSKLDQVVRASDVIISAVTGDNLIIAPRQFENESTLHKLLIDLSVPRSMESGLDQVPGLALYNVDQLNERTAKARVIREAAVPNAKMIISEVVADFNQWKQEMEVFPAIQRLKTALDQIRKDELSRHSSKVSVEEMELLELVTKNMIQKVIKLPVLQLKAACQRGEAETLVGVLNDLFNLEIQKMGKD